jgi:hypothetical protein
MSHAARTIRVGALCRSIPLPQPLQSINFPWHRRQRELKAVSDAHRELKPVADC